MFNFFQSILASEKYAGLFKAEVQDGEDLAFITYTEDMLPYASTFVEGFADATFQTCGTRCFYQKLTMFGKISVPGKPPGYLPLFHVFMTSKTQSLYPAIFHKLRELVPAFRPTLIMTDFERALRAALTECFPGTRLAGCHFHYAQECLIHFLLVISILGCHFFVNIEISYLTYKCNC